MNPRIIKYLWLEVTHKDHQVHILSLHWTAPKNPPRVQTGLDNKFGLIHPPRLLAWTGSSGLGSSDTNMFPGFLRMCINVFGAPHIPFLRVFCTHGECFARLSVCFQCCVLFIPPNYCQKTCAGPGHSISLTVVEVLRSPPGFSVMLSRVSSAGKVCDMA